MIFAVKQKGKPMRAIDADAFKVYMRDALEQTRNAYSDKGEWAETITEQFCEDIDEQPTIEPQRKKGKWLHDGYAFKGGIDWMHCSECGHKDSWSVATRTPFCAWCGADMREDGEADADVES